MTHRLLPRRARGWRSPSIAVVGSVLLFGAACPDKPAPDAGDDSSGQTTGDTAPTNDDSSTGSDTSTGFDRFGVCGLLGQATASAATYVGTEEHYLIGEEGHGEDVCRVRVDVAYVGPPAVPCELCEWAVQVEFRNPQVVTDVDGGCADSDLRLDAATIAALAGRRAAYGYAEEFVGHNDVLMEFDEALGTWEARTFASYDAAMQKFRYDRRDGFCGY